MTGEPVIELRRVGKRYREYDETPSLLASLRRRPTKHFWAVHEVDLQVAAGERVAVLGRNGAGKTTLLSLVAGVTAPTSGRVVVRGVVAPLLGVGVGFAPELTGRENVFVNGSVLGLSSTEIARRYDEIVEFAGLESFMDTPVNTYSSGMFVRLGFAVAASARPDVLLVDEVLSVGDAAFQARCTQRMQELAAAGTTVVAVSHNLAGLRSLCTRGIVLDAGRVVADLSFEEAAVRYVELVGGFGAGAEQGPAVTLSRGSDLPLLPDAEADFRLSWPPDLAPGAEQVTVWVGVGGPSGEAVYSELLARPVSVSEGHADIRLRLRVAAGSYTLYAAVRLAGRVTALARAAPLPFEVTGSRPVGDGVGLLEVRLSRAQAVG